MNDADTTLSWATKCAVCDHEKKCAVARSRKCILCTHPVAFSCIWLDAKNATNLKKQILDGGQRSRILSWMFSWSILLRFSWACSYFRNCFIDYLWSDHLSSCQLCCCHPFQVEDHSCEIHQDVEDHWEEEDEVGSSRSFAKYCSQFSLSHPRYLRILGSNLSFNRFLPFVGICTTYLSRRDCRWTLVIANIGSWCPGLFTNGMHYIFSFVPRRYTKLQYLRRC